MINENMEKFSDEKEEQIAREYHEEGWDDQTPQVESAEEKPENWASEAQRAEESVEARGNEFKEQMMEFIERTGGADARKDVEAAQAESEKIKKEVEGAGDGGQMSEEEMRELYGFDYHSQQENKDFEEKAKNYAEGLSKKTGLTGEEYSGLLEQIRKRGAEEEAVSRLKTGPEAEPQAEDAETEGPTIEQWEKFAEQLTVTEKTKQNPLGAPEDSPMGVAPEAQAELSRLREKSAQEVGNERLDKVMGFAKRFLRKGAALLAPGILAKNAMKATKETAIKGGKNLAVLGLKPFEAIDRVGERVSVKAVERISYEIKKKEGVQQTLENLPKEKREREHVKAMIERLYRERGELQKQRVKEIKYLAKLKGATAVISQLKAKS